MKATELRIGNYVFHKENVLRITNIIDFCVNMEFGEQSGERNSEIDIDEISPIPLTPELLEKCGFGQGKTISPKWLTENLARFSIKVIVDEGYITIHKDCDRMFFSFGSIEYLHQLQNLVFTLTGEELQYTP